MQGECGKTIKITKDEPKAANHQQKASYQLKVAEGQPKVVKQQLISKIARN